MPVGQNVSDGRLPGSAGDQQLRVALQQQTLIAGGEASASEHKRPVRQGGHRIEQPHQEVVLTEGRSPRGCLRNRSRRSSVPVTMI